MIKPIENSEIPDIVRRGETGRDLEEFMTYDAKFCEVEVKGSTAEKVRGRYYAEIRKKKLPIKTMVRDNRVFLMKEGK